MDAGAWRFGRVARAVCAVGWFLSPPLCLEADTATVLRRSPAVAGGTEPHHNEGVEY
jgi:hypothetical protein